MIEIKCVAQATSAIISLCDLVGDKRNVDKNV